MKYKTAASARSDEELLERIDNRQNYMPETIEASVEGLQYRGHNFSDEELKVISEDVAALRQNAVLAGVRTGIFSDNYKNVIVKDPDAPSLYSRRVIYAFAFFFNPLFGSVMMAMNVYTTDNLLRVLWIIIFGLTFTILERLILPITGAPVFFLVLFQITGASILESFYWRRYIGDTTFYRTRSIWPLLVIGVVLSGLYIVALMYSGQLGKV